MTKFWMFLLGAFVALTIGCGAPPSSDDDGGGNTIPIACDGADCATLDIVVSRPATVEILNTDLTVNYASINERVDPDDGTWLVSVVAGEYIVCAYASGVDPACEQKMARAGEHTPFDCRFREDRHESRAVPIALAGADGAEATLDGESIAIEDGKVAVPMDNELHVFSARKDHYTGSEFEVDTSATLPAEIVVELGYNPGWYCTETEGPEVGTPAAESGPIRAVASGGHVVLQGLLDATIPGLVGTIVHDTDDSGATVDVEINISAATIDVRLTDEHGVEYHRSHHACRTAP